MEQESDDVSNIHDRFSLTLVNPGSKYFSLVGSLVVGIVIEKNEVKSENPLKKTLEKKLEVLSKELEQEMNHDKQQSILKSINLVLEMMEKVKKQ